MKIGDRRKFLGKVLTYIFFVMMVVLILFPVYWLVVCSLKENSEIYATPPSFLPTHPTFDNFVGAFRDSDCLMSLLNSVFVSATSMIFTLLVSVCAAYAVTRMRFYGKKIYWTMIACTQVFPMVVAIVPLYLLYRKVGLYNTHTSLILTYTAMCVPIAFTLLIGYFNDLPQALEEAAMVDGCGRIRSMCYILVPVARSGIVATGIYVFLNCWQEFLVAVSLIGERSKYTLTLALTSFQSEHSVNWGGLMAVSVIIGLPAVIMFFFIQKYFVESLSGAVKG